MQFIYQFPEMVERLVLVSSGGLGPDVSPVLRAAALPGAELFISATAGIGSQAGSLVGRGLGLLGMRPNADVAEVARGYAPSPIPSAARPSSPPCVRSSAPRASASPPSTSLYLAETLPLLIVWGEHDPIIPASHAAEAQPSSPTAASRSSRAPATCPSWRAPAASSPSSNASSPKPSRSEFDRDEWRARFKVAENYGRARQDSNLWPTAPEAVALSS